MFHVVADIGPPVDVSTTRPTGSTSSHRASKTTVTAMSANAMGQTCVTAVINRAAPIE